VTQNQISIQFTPLRVITHKDIHTHRDRLNLPLYPSNTWAWAMTDVLRLLLVPLDQAPFPIMALCCGFKD